MANQDSTQQTRSEEKQGFPIQLKFLLAVIALGVLLMIVKAFRIF